MTLLENYWVHFVVFAVIILAFVLSMVMGFIYIERRGIGRFQARLGPNRAGPFGLLQPVADAIKVLLKEFISISISISFSIPISFSI